MKIIIVGDGKVGYALTEQLSRENHDIVVIERDAKALQKAINVFDVMGIQGNGASREVQEEAGVDSADVLIAATSADELNILCCLVAKKLGAEHTIARVRNPEYLEQLRWMKKDLGLSMTVNPEYEAAQEIFRTLRTPGAIKIDSFAKGRVELAEVRITEDSKLDSLKLSELRQRYKQKILVCAVSREKKVIIPNGEFTLREGDKIHITAPPDEMSAFFKKIGVLKQRVHSVMLIGGGRISYYLAKMLLDIGMHVTIIEINPARCAELNALLPEANIVNGDGSEQEVLREEGINEIDAFIALTNLDEENMIMSMYAKDHEVPKIIVKINRRSFHNIMIKAGVDSIVSPKMLTTYEIVRYIRAMQNSVGDNMESLYKILEGRAEALEFNIFEDSDITDVPLKRLSLKQNLIIAAIVREGRIIMPTGESCIRLGD
ncbi:MAG: Trk system potassium transporter TrkA, partial [Oscillospiraceae bacterium]|nr:Trk system potassium transporter TrkA [Oscillospiraceae bacterium]